MLSAPRSSLFKVREKAVIIRQSSSSSFRMSSFGVSRMSPSLAKTRTMLAFSNVERLAMLRNWMNSFFEVLPDPSAILFGIDRPALLTCSANLKNLFSSKKSANLNNFLATSTARCQISKFSNRNFVTVFVPISLLYASCYTKSANVFSIFRK